MKAGQDAVPVRADDAGFAGHPRGLAPLFFTEVWERFSYYGMRAILVLYMVAPAAQGGLGFDTKRAASIYGTYTMAVYLTAIPGDSSPTAFSVCASRCSSAASSSRPGTFRWCSARWRRSTAEWP